MFQYEKIRDINNRLTALVDKRNIVIWGAGVHTCKLFEKTKLLSYQIKYIVDIDENKQGRYFFGYKVMNPDEIIWNDVDALIISVPGREREIANLKQIGGVYNKKVIFLYGQNESTPFYNLYDNVTEATGYIGDYDQWEKAHDECGGYDDPHILSTVVSATKAVMNGIAAYERDGYLFYEQKYNYNLCAIMLRCAIQNNNNGVRVLDIGGSLGSTYFQNKKYLEEIKGLEYIIAEQNSFVEYGQNNLENKNLKFICSEENWGKYGSYDIILLSGSLQYIPNYNDIVYKILQASPSYIVLDRIVVGNRKRICKEFVSKKIYNGSYPVRIFTEDEIINFFVCNYELVEKDISSVREDGYAYFTDDRAVYKYYVFKKLK